MRVVGQERVCYNWVSQNETITCCAAAHQSEGIKQ